MKLSAQDALWAVAIEQYGYVTTNDARDSGIAPVAVRQLVHRGKLESAARGVYRFPKIPVTQYDAYMLAVLWTGSPAARLSHETALANYETCDINPERIHLCVPRSARIRRKGGEMYVLHYEGFGAEDESWWCGIPTVTLAAAMRQCIATGTPADLVRQALENGRRNGLLLPGEVAGLEQRLAERAGR